ncbi:hypothetical protein K2173_024844 [Erythroxylum novogranatense]|uniref:Uncharacterized protein n=1 Tax=Erythroxylum novogranatense TaxID=1862640 RepID=A0AAV8UDS7_9ROSI|nr:hypothetical protein K2173_024844 [Erythroxylum novogranatense]
MFRIPYRSGWIWYVKSDRPVTRVSDCITKIGSYLSLIPRLFPILFPLDTHNQQIYIHTLISERNSEEHKKGNTQEFVTFVFRRALGRRA